MNAADLLTLERNLWVLACLIGTGFFGWLLYRAVGDLRVRKGANGARRSAVLLAWQRVAFDGCLLFTMLLDLALAIISYRPGNGWIVIIGFILDKLVVVALAGYLLWNRRETKAAGQLETRPLRR